MPHSYKKNRLFLVLALFSVVTGCIESPNTQPDAFPLGENSLLPQYGYDETTQIAAGKVTGNAPNQPIAFTHKRHVDLLNIQCEYCHSEARKSIHAGVPPVQTCANCHANVQNVKARPEIKRVMDYCDYDMATRRCKATDAIPWQKVHDLPDFVRFSHKRHVRAGVNCTECHGQVGLMEGTRVGESDVVENTMVREATLQMGWCLDCHASHPSIIENYCENPDVHGEVAQDCEQSNIRRAELKDCWTCHK